jgi:hypothetical protein
MNKSYEIIKGHSADFRVKYRFYSQSEGGRKTLPWQGYRSDFYYNHPAHENPYSIYMIWPEFEDLNGSLIKENIVVPFVGTARMWIIDPQYRLYHRNKICVGLQGYFMEGSRRVAECEVIEVIGLFSNPTS